jgi:hypothetical protein
MIQGDNMKYGDKIMNTDYYQKLKETGNSLAKKYLSHPLECSIAKGIPIKYLPLFKEFSRKVKGLRIRYRGNSKPGYRRPRDFVHMAYADTFAIYKR